MANLKETSVWEPTIRQLETSDPVMGGENGVSNTAPRQITNRTLWLKNALADAVENITTLGTTKANKATTLAGYGITDATKVPSVSAEVDVNKYTSNGVFITPTTGLLNLPKNWPQNRYFIDVARVKDSSYIRQSINSSTDTLSAYRVYNGTAWTDWVMNYGVNPLSANNIAFNYAVGNAAYPFRNGELSAGQYSDGVIFAADLGDGDAVQIVATTDGKTLMRSQKAGVWTAKQLDDAAWENIRNKPTTLSGYGITDAVNAPTVSTQTDINNYQTNGTFMTPATGLTNLPAGWSQGRYFVDVTKTVGSSYIRQSITNTTSNQTASRVWSGTSWTEWEINTSNSMFVGVLDESGYCTLPNGLIMQWGKATVVSSGTTVTLPIRFPNKAVAVAAGISSAKAPTEALYAYALTASQIIVDMSGPNTAVATWIAYGY